MGVRGRTGARHREGWKRTGKRAEKGWLGDGGWLGRTVGWMSVLRRMCSVLLGAVLCGAWVGVIAEREASAAGSWVEHRTRAAFGGSVLLSDRPWSGASFDVRGPRMTMWFVANERGGRAVVLVNGTRVKTVEMYSKRTTRRSVQLRGGSGLNVVSVVVAPDRHERSKGTRVNVDAFSVGKRCTKGCVTSPRVTRTSNGELDATGTWYPQQVPDVTSAAWSVAIGSYVRGRDATPTDAARPVVRAAACEMAQRVSRGVMVLSFGKQVSGGTNGFGKKISNNDVIEVSRAWASGLAECGAGPWEVAVSTSNSGGVTVENGFDGGARWAQLVEETARLADPRVVVSAGVDLEPGWGPPGQARAWVDGYVASSGRRLWNFGSADGCPQTYLSRLTCNNGWTIDDVIWVSSRAGSQVVAMPQLHTQSGSLAKQWAVLAERAVKTGEPMRIAAVGVQTAACAQVRGGCPTTGESAWNSWAKLRGLLDARSATRGMPLGAPRDIRWGWGGAFVVPQPTTTTSTTTTSTTTPITTTTRPSTTTIPGSTSTSTPSGSTTTSTSTTRPA
jgi:hypothetical protein